ncbi:hypothetical protein HHK36_017081 [Tetracentron sinense]|uniref:Uncharacterized protein n=1 Tax=Tetracentron sinense TaxID=13715 RepID=A0A834Z230_TETSI|nr:hypothetical protein HHK36_017081 [Tetracentron sinense]
MSSKTLARSGASLIRQLFNPFLHQKSSSSHDVFFQSSEISSKLFPSFSKFQTALHLPESDTETLKKVHSEEILYPHGLPSLRFFLPDDGLMWIHAAYKTGNNEFLILILLLLLVKIFVVEVKTFEISEDNGRSGLLFKIVERELYSSATILEIIKYLRGMQNINMHIQCPEGGVDGFHSLKAEENLGGRWKRSQAVEKVEVPYQFRQTRVVNAVENRGARVQAGRKRFQRQLRHPLSRRRWQWVQQPLQKACSLRVEDGKGVDRQAASINETLNSRENDKILLDGAIGDEEQSGFRVNGFGLL